MHQNSSNPTIPQFTTDNKKQQTTFEFLIPLILDLFHGILAVHQFPFG